MTLPAWPHQEQTKRFFDVRPRGNDFSDPGVGKTRTQIDCFNSDGRILVACPKTLMYSAWGADIEKFSGATYSLAYAENREEAFDMKTDVVIINTDGVKWLADKGRKYLPQFNQLVIDESSYYKHATSQRSKAARAISKHFKYRRALSATPNARSVTELFYPMLIVDDGKRLGTSFSAFRNSVQIPTQVGPMSNHIRWDDRPGAAQAIEELISDITIRHRFEDVMTHVPPNHREHKSFTLSKKLQAMYAKLESECYLRLKDEDLTAVHAASLRTKLLQLCSGAVYTSEGKYELLDTQRYDLIYELIEPRPHSVVFFNWKHQRDELAKRFDAAGFSFAIIDGDTPQRERDRIVKDYQAGYYRTVLMHPRTGAHGLTLTRGTTTVVSSPIYEADLLKQALHRIYRGDQNQVTNTVLIEAEGTVERLVYDQLSAHEAQMVDLLQLIAARRKP